MKDFETWFTELISDQRWHELSSMHHREETFKACAKKVFMQGVADGIFKPIQEARKHVYNIICKTPGDRPKGKPWYEQALEKKILEDAAKDEWKPVSWDKRAEYLNKVQEIIKGSTMMSGVPRPSYKEQAEEGLPPKPAPYPCTTPEEAYVRDRHFEYVRRYYEPRTGEKLPDWIPEEEFNKLYDEGLI